MTIDLEGVVKKACVICKSDNRKFIENEYILGKSINYLSKKYEHSFDTVSKHIKYHLPESIIAERKGRLPELNSNKYNVDVSKEIPSIKNLADCIEYIHNETVDIHIRSKEKGEDNTSLKALKQDTECISLVMKAKEIMLGANRQHHWETTLSKILKVLEEFPDAKAAIAAELMIDYEGKWGKV